MSGRKACCAYKGMGPGVSEPWMIQTAWNAVESHIYYLLSTQMQCALDSSHMGCRYKNTLYISVRSLCNKASIHKTHCDAFKLTQQHTQHILPYFNAYYKHIWMPDVKPSDHRSLRADRLMTPLTHPIEQFKHCAHPVEATELLTELYQGFL